jgi:TorA maturation chaperone TorD
MEASQIIIYPKDVQVLTGRSQKQAQRILQKTRRSLNRKKDHLVTILEFCSFCEFAEDEVLKALHK